MSQFSYKVGETHTITVDFKDGGGASVPLHSPAVWAVDDPTILSVVSTGLNTAQVVALRSNPDGSPATANISATAEASPWNTAFTGGTAADVAPVVVTITAAIFS
jgi:hypothetical protein